MTLVRFLFTAAVCGCWALPSTAQSSVSGRYLLEPVVGLFAGDLGQGVTLFGGRGTWRRSYDRTYCAEFLYGARSSESVHDLPDSQSRYTSSTHHIIASIGIGSTVLDRDATGLVGAHALLGLGLISSRSRSLSENQWQGEPPERHESVRKLGGPMVSFSLVGEAELASPRLLLRIQPSAYVSWNVIPQEFQDTTSMFGASLTAGLAFAL